MILYQCILKDLRTHFSYQCIPKGLSASADVLGEFAFPKDLRGRAQRSPAWRQNRLAQRSGSHALTWLGPRVHRQRIESRKLGPRIQASLRKEILFQNFRRAAAKDQESTRVDDPYYASCYHKAGPSIARIAHFLLLKKGHSKRMGHVAHYDLAGCARGDN